MSRSAETPVDRPAVLVVEDEPAILSMARIVLDRAGYAVTAAADGPAALAAFGDDVAVVVLDVKLPGLSGWDVLAELRRRQPDLPVVLTTGGSYDSDPDEAADAPTAMLPKPYRPADLVDAVGRALAAR